MQNQLKYIISVKDSSTLAIKNLSNKDFFVRCLTQVPNEYNQYLSEYLKGDSLIYHLTGWWQLVSPTNEKFHLPNNSIQRKIHKLHLDKNGEANFYFFPHKDSSEYYGWTVKPNVIDFARGCIPKSNTEIISLNENELKIFIQFNIDTLVFKRSVPLN